MSAARRFTQQEVAPGHVAAAPMPTTAELAQFYAESYYQQLASTTYKAEYSDDELAHRRLRARLLVHALRQARAAPGRLLEVGAGEGFVLDAAVQAGFDALGLDFSDFAIRRFHPHLATRLQAGDALESLARLQAAGERFAVVALQNVIEHVIDPSRLLRGLAGVLGPGALLAATVPNDFSRVQARARELGLVREDYWFAPPQHLHFFTSEGICDLIADCGYRVIDRYADFPVEFFLYHRGSNYALDPAQGPDAHRARVLLDLLLSERGLEPYFQFCKALAACGMGRNTTVLFRVAGI